MKTIESTLTKDGYKLSIIERLLTDRSIVYDIRLMDGNSLCFETSCYDEKDAFKRFGKLKDGLSS